MTHDEQKPAMLSSSVIAKAAEAMHNRGVELGLFGVEWNNLPKDSKVRYEELVTAALMSATTREAELLAVIRAMDGALRYVEAHYDGMEKADIVSKAIRLAEQVV